MIRYKGKLNTETSNLISSNLLTVKDILSKESLNGLGNVGDVISIEESIELYNKGISKEEIQAWVWYKRKNGYPMKGWNKYSINSKQSIPLSLVNKGVLFFISTDEAVPYPIFAHENIYDRIKQVEKIKDFIVSTYGDKIYENHIEVLNKLIPTKLSISNPVETERPRILAVSSLAKEFKVNSLKSSTGVILNDSETLFFAFQLWLNSLGDNDFVKSKPYEIIRYYLSGDRKPNHIDKIEWRSIEKNSRDEGEKLFNRFLYEALEFSDQQKLDLIFNRTMNAHAPIQHHKIPVGFEISKTFHGFPLEIRPAQREGIAFMELVGSGIIAYDVGVGKTITAIIELANALKNNKASRPLIVVPNPTYKNWIKEMFGYEGKAGILTGTNYKLNEWYNLGSEILSTIDIDKEIPKGTITLVTYEGFNKIGFGEGIESKLFFELSNIMEQENQTARAEEKKNEKYRELLGIGLSDTIADIEKLGFDYLVVDEAHNYKNVFSEVKKQDDDNKKRFHIKGGKPSNRAIKLFFIANYIQRTFGRNTMLLTATPFTNSPLEVYSMLSLVGYEYLKKMDLYNISRFFEQFILETSEYVVGIDGEIKQANVVKSFNNRIALQKIIHNHINFKTGEEANIPRPCKVNLPKTNEVGVKLKKDEQILTYLQMSEKQEDNQNFIVSEAQQGASKDDPGRLLKILGDSLNNALSPFIYSKTQPVDYLDFVNESPKIKYALECIKSVKDYHEKRNESVSGQVIYIDRGKDYFSFIKEYLEKEVGYKKSQSLISNPKLKVDEVEIISSGISQSKKEKIKDAFNEGVCKIIIGTSTIREGINLQKKGTVLYNLFPNWNPTDIRQLEGRIWRQKNEFGYVRIVMPLMENSMDVFVFQKLEEKTNRINDIWAKSDRGNVLDEDSLNTEEIKFALITDLGVLTRFEIKQKQEELDRKISVLKNNIDDIETFQSNYQKYKENKEKVKTDFTESVKLLLNKRLVYDNSNYYGLFNINTLPTNISLKDSDKKLLERAKKVYDEAIEFENNPLQEDKILINLKRKLNSLLHNSYSSRDYYSELFKEYLSKYQKTLRSLLEPRGYNESSDFDKIIQEFKNELIDVENELAILKTDEYYDTVFREVAEQKEKLSIKGGDISSRVNDFKKLNYLMSYKFSDVDHTSCKLPTKELPPRKKENRKLNNILLLKAKAKAKARIRILKLKK